MYIYVVLILAVVILGALAVLSFFKPKIMLALKKADLDVVKDAQDVSEKAKSLQKKKGGSIGKQVKEDLKNIKDAEDAVDDIKDSL